MMLENCLSSVSMRFVCVLTVYHIKYSDILPTFTCLCYFETIIDMTSSASFSCSVMCIFLKYFFGQFSSTVGKYVGVIMKENYYESLLFLSVFRNSVCPLSPPKIKALSSVVDITVQAKCWHGSEIFHWHRKPLQSMNGKFLRWNSTYHLEVIKTPCILQHPFVQSHSSQGFHFRFTFQSCLTGGPFIIFVVKLTNY